MLLKIALLEIDFVFFHDFHECSFMMKFYKHPENLSMFFKNKILFLFFLHFFQNLLFTRATIIIMIQSLSLLLKKNVRFPFHLSFLYPSLYISHSFLLLFNFFLSSLIFLPSILPKIESIVSCFINLPKTHCVW